MLQGLKKEQCILDWIDKLQVVSDSDEGNKFNVAFTERNCVHLIECKAADLAHNDEHAAAVTYKLEALCDQIGGLFCRAMLVSYRPLVEADLRRCQESRVRVIEQRIAGLPRRTKIVMQTCCKLLPAGPKQTASSSFSRMLNGEPLIWTTTKKSR